MSPAIIHSVPSFQAAVHVHRKRSRARTEPKGVSGARIKEFDPFRLDTVNQCLWERGNHGDEERILLKPKAFGILRYLVDHAGRLVTQDELLDALWPDTHVQPEVLKRHVVDIRDVLGDNPKSPTYIETRPWLGYQFIAAVRDATSDEPGAPDIPARNKLAGEDQALGDLQAYLGKAVAGRRQIVFVAGEPGIGKTTLVEEFQRRAASNAPLRIARGRCSEDDGRKQAYYPMLEALGNLCCDPAGTTVAQILRARASTWLTQFPWLVNRGERPVPQFEIPGSLKQRMLLEMGDALETITSASPLLLVLEDLHWVDPFTVDLISAVAHGRRAAKLMLIGTYRPVGSGSSGHPLGAIESDLQVHRYIMNSFWSRCGKWE